MPAKGWRKGSIPKEFGGFQVNFCKNPNCPQYGIPAEIPIGSVTPPVGAATLPGYFYLCTKRIRIRKLSLRTNHPSIRCLLCGGGKFSNNIPLKNNEDIYAEYMRMISVFERNDPTRHSDACSKKDVSFLDHPSEFQAHTATSAGTQRRRCKECKVVFSIGVSPFTRRRDLPRTAQAFKAMVDYNSHLTGLRRSLNFGTGSLYRRFEFFYRQCKAFAAYHERKLFDGTFKIDWLNLSIDRQVLRANYKDHTDARYVKIWTIGTADNNSKYVFAFHPQYDASANYRDVINEIAAQTLANSGRSQIPPFRVLIGVQY